MKGAKAARPAKGAAAPAADAVPTSGAAAPAMLSAGVLLALALALVGAQLWGSGDAAAAPGSAAERDAVGGGSGPKPPDGPELTVPTPLMRAAMMGDAEMMRQLLTAAPASRRGSVNAAVTGGITALHFALNGRMNQMQDDSLVRELKGSHEDCVALLLEHGADPMVGHLSALWYAASFRNYEIMALTAANGGDTNDRADGGWSLLHEVSASKASGMARFFMKPAIDAKLLKLMRLQPLTPLGSSPLAEPFNLPRLQAACQSEDVRLLIKHGAVVDWQDEKNRTALHIAAGDSVLPAVEALLEAGADPNLRGADGAAALHRAAASSHAFGVAVVEALLSAGADPTQVDDYGRTPAAVARQAHTHTHTHNPHHNCGF